MTGAQVKAGGREGVTFVHRPANYFAPLDLVELFPVERPLEVELGSGDGSFLAQWAQRHPERNFLGVERLLGRLRKLDRKALRGGSSNLRLLRIEAGYFMEYLLPPQSVSAIHVYFPDPWPKRKHRRHRLINEQFTRLAARVLKPSGHVFLRTDDADYFSQMIAVFDGNAEFRRVEPSADLLAVVTDFERDFHAAGVKTLAAAYQR